VKPRFFESPAELRAWFEANHHDDGELLVGYYKKGTGRPSVTWPESVDEALCVGWIDGIRRNIDAVSYSIRFTPRKPRSVWSAVNIARAKALAKRGRMRPAGRKAFAARMENRSGIYSYEQRSERLPEPYARIFRKDRAAWRFFRSCTPGYRKVIGWWIVSAKREETRLRRLAHLMDLCARGELLPALTRYRKAK